MNIKRITSEDIAMILEGLLYGDDDGFQDVLENGYGEIEALAERMREIDQVYTISNFE